MRLKQKPTEKRAPGRWYLADKGKVHEAVRAHVAFIASQQREQRREVRHFLDLYSAGNVAGLGTQTPRERLLDYLFEGRAATRFNMVAAVCDTAVSMIAQQPAVPQYLTTGGDFSLMRRAEKRSQVLQCQMNDLAGDLCPRAFLDATKAGSGFVTGYLDDNGLPALERVHMLELFVEHADGINGKPRSIHRVYLRSKEVLKAQFPGFEREIEKAPPPSKETVDALFLDVKGCHDMVEVYESHHLRSIKRLKRDHDGRHAVCIATADLLDEKYEHDDFPYVKVDYRERDFGYYGSGLAESAREAQTRVNELIARVARAQDLASTLIIANPTGGDVSVKHEQISNELGLIIDYDPANGPPQLMKWDGTLGDLQEQIDLEFQRVLMVEGLSQEQVNGEGAGKGLTSGVAVRAADDVQSRRLVSPTKRYQSFCIGVAKLIERLNDDAVEDAKRREEQYEVRGKATQGRRTFLRSSRWEELSIPEGQADIVMAPMSALPTTPQGKWAAVQEWIGSGFVSKQYAMSLLQFPDIDAYADIELAHLDMVQWQIERMLDGESVIPFPRQDLQMAMDLVTKSELKAITMGAPPEVIDLMEAYLVQVSEMLKPPAPPPGMQPPGAPGPVAGPQGPGPMPPGGPRPGQPMPPPQMAPGGPMGAPVMVPRPPPQPVRPGVAA